MTPALRQRHLAHAITLTQHVREIIDTTNPGPAITPDEQRHWKASYELTHLIEELLYRLETLHDACEK